MPIVPSRRREVHALLERLDDPDPALRDSAAARLILLGERALDPLGAFLRGASASARLAALSVLDASSGPRALPMILNLFDDPDATVARRAVELAGARSAAVPALGALVARPGPLRSEALKALGRLCREGAVEALDPLLGVLTDEDAATSHRLIALDAVTSLGSPRLGPVLRRLGETRNAALAERVRALERGEPARGRLADPRSAETALHEALADTEDPRALRVLIDRLEPHASASSIPVLHSLLGHVRDRSAAAGRDEARAGIHRVLARLGSRIALYDLREALLERPVPAAADLLQAAETIGDATLVPALAHLHGDRPDLRDTCSRVFRAIARRERLRRNSRAVKAVHEADRNALDQMWERGSRARSRSPRKANH